MRRFEHPSGKFWSVDPTGPTFTVRWGALGTGGQVVTRECGSAADVKIKVAEQIERQLKLGYVEVAAAIPPRPTVHDRWYRRLVNAIESLELVREGTTVVQRRGSLRSGETSEQRFEHDSVLAAEETISRLLAKATEQKFRVPGTGLVLDDDDDEVEEEEPEPPAPSNPALEAACRAAPEDPATWSVYADWFLEQGDVRGEVAATFQREPTSWKSKDLVRMHRSALFKSDEIGRVCEITRWCHGFPVAIAIRTREGSELTQLEATKTIVSRPFIQFVETLHFGLQDFEGNNDWGPTLAAVTDSQLAPHLRSLRFDDFDEFDEAGFAFGDFSAAWPKLPALEELWIKSHLGGTLGTIALPKLRRFVRISNQLDDSELDSIRTAHWPLLEHLELWIGEAEPERILPLFSATTTPALRHLGLVSSDIVDKLIPALAGSPLLGRLRSLDLSRGELEDSTVLVAFAAAFKHLESLDLSRNCLSPGQCEALRVVLPNARLAEQRAPHHYDDTEE